MPAAKDLVSKLEMLVEETDSLIQSTSDASYQYWKDTSSFLDEFATLTCPKVGLSLISECIYSDSTKRLLNFVSFKYKEIWPENYVT